MAAACFCTPLRSAPPAGEPDTAQVLSRRDALLEMYRRDPVARQAIGVEIATLETVLANRALRERRFEEATERYRSALLYKDDLEPARAGLVACLIQTEQLDYALSEAQVGLSRLPQSADLLALQGEVLYRLNRLDEAVASWKQSLAARPDTGLQQRVAQVENERQRTEQFRTSEAPHFTLQYDGDRLGTAMEDALLTALEETYNEYVRTFDHIPDAVITVILYTRQTFQDITEAPSNVEGLFDGKVRLPMGGLSNLTSSARAVARHEVAHAFIHSKTRGAAPRWLHEGIAQWLEPRSSRSQGPALAREARQRGPEAPVPFSYPAALSQVEYLVDAYGAHGLMDLLQRLHDGMGMDAALRETYRCDTRGLGSEWGQWLARSFPGGR